MMLAQVASSEVHKTYRWRSSNACYDHHLATGSIAVYDDVESSQSNTQGSGVKLSGSWFPSGNYLLLN
jgi:hypothetical protein